MANNKSALKRIKVNERNRVQNKRYKIEMQRILKKYLITLEEHRTSPSEESFGQVKHDLSLAYQKLDKCVKANILHANTAAHKKAKLAALLHITNVNKIENINLPKIKSIKTN
jgi:small subunit ribosomal protein S20|tara:strand:- start:13590 stop:13928 length:339 start_codon:yes stop_codon:yes gene_type:complete